MGIGYPVAIDSDYAIWRAFGNHYWPALYFCRRAGTYPASPVREGEYQRSEMIIQQLLVEAGFGIQPRRGFGSTPVAWKPRPIGPP